MALRANSEGIRTPSRATLLTGQYSHLNGVPVFNRFDGSRDRVAKRLQAGGYHTGVIGKWHLGSDPTGFDRWIVLPGQGAYWNPQVLIPGGRKLNIEGHCTDIATDLGLEFLKMRPQVLSAARVSDAGGRARPHWQLTWPARVRSSELLCAPDMGVN